MARLRVLSGRDVCKILANVGFVAVRQRGSHIVMRVGTLQSIIRQSGLTRALFEA